MGFGEYIDGNLWWKALSKYGGKAQLGMVIEECAELIQAINKCDRREFDSASRIALIEEIADVIIMIDQLPMILSGMFKVSDAQIMLSIDEMIEAKRQGLKIRLGE